MLSLDGKVAVIVGASKGIGKATATVFAEAGASVVLAARSKDTLEAVAADLAGPGRTIVAVPTDIGRKEDVQRLFETTISRCGDVDVMVNCAGGTDQPDWNPLLDLTEEQWDHVVDMNLRAAFFLAQAAATAMKDRGGGAIINLSSRSASIPNPGNGHFCASKAGLESLTRSMALEWAEFGIRVNAIAPGLVPTEGTDFLVPSNAHLKRVVDRTPLGRLGTAADVAALALFLASDASSWMTGITIPINGGSPVPNAYWDFLDQLANRRGQ